MISNYFFYKILKPLGFLLVAFLFMSCAGAKVDSTKLKLPSIFSDNMVLQQNFEVTVWGNAATGQEVNVIPSWGRSVTTSSDDKGKWSAKIKTPGAGGPYELKVVCGGDSIRYKNILMGEVWLCSGQSNMEMPLGGWPPNDTIFTAANEIPNANYPNLRFFTVERTTSISPEEDCKGSWSLCTPATASTFSATAFFFGKKLMTDLNVPIGLIHSSWGGSPIEAWMGAEPLSNFPEYAEYIKGMENYKEESERLKTWLAKLPQIDMNGKSGTNIWENLDFGDASMSNLNFDDSNWPTTDMPADWSIFGFGNFDGVIWFRTKIDIPDNWMNRELTLSLGPIDDMDVTFVNGTRVGGYETGGHWQTERNYVIPAKLVNSKSLLIAVRVLDNMQGGGMYGRNELFRLRLNGSQESISIAGKWRYLPVAEYKNSIFYLYSGNNFDFASRPKVTSEVTSNSPTTLFNAMINPIVPFKIRGAIWYQGESNTYNPDRYKELFPLMVENWRNLWGDQFSFYFTQIAPYRYNEGTNSQFLREAQFLSMSIPKSGMAVTLDIGNPLNIHPGNKKDVGERLALWALLKDYNKNISHSGPVYKSFSTDRSEIILSFDHSDGLILKPLAGKFNFQIAGDDKIFHEATAVVNGTNIIVSSPKVKSPVAVRYCWSDTAEATLFNGAGLPASSFRTDKWK
ncbi:sialate O-acetylesterase [Ignavibacteriales bacterium]